MKPSFYVTLKQDLHPTWRWVVLIYYTHFYVVYFFVVILVGITKPDSDTWKLWLAILIAQIIFNVGSIIRMFESKFMCFMNFYTECQITGFVIFAYLNTYDFMKAKRDKYTTMYEYGYLGSMIFASVMLFVNNLVQFVIWICMKIRNRCKW